MPADTTEQWQALNRIRAAVSLDDNNQKALALREEYIKAYGRGRPDNPPCSADDCSDTCPDPEGYRGSPFECSKHAEKTSDLIFAGLTDEPCEPLTEDSA